MSVIRWEEKYALEVEVVDRQHRRLVEMINEFYLGIQQKTADAALTELLDGLISYAESHFRTEESLMRKHEFPFKVHHIGEHDLFRGHVGDCRRRVGEGKLVLSFEITTYLRQWLLDHILASDKRLCQFLRTKGVK